MLSPSLSSIRKFVAKQVVVGISLGKKSCSYRRLVFMECIVLGRMEKLVVLLDSFRLVAPYQCVYWHHSCETIHVFLESILWLCCDMLGFSRIYHLFYSTRLSLHHFIDSYSIRWWHFILVSQPVIRRAFCGNWFPSPNPWLQARRYIMSLKTMIAQDLSKVLLGANPQGETSTGKPAFHPASSLEHLSGF